MSISSGVRRKLWAASGGYCGNPAFPEDYLRSGLTKVIYDTLAKKKKKEEKKKELQRHEVRIRVAVF